MLVRGKCKRSQVRSAGAHPGGLLEVGHHKPPAEPLLPARHVAWGDRAWRSPTGQVPSCRNCFYTLKMIEEAVDEQRSLTVLLGLTPAPWL